MVSGRFICLITWLIFSANVNGVELEAMGDAQLTQILNNFEVIAEAKSPQSDAMWVRILKVQEPGECGARLASCPKSRVYIAVSEYGEYPEQKLYRLPLLHNWQFDQWLSLPDTDGDNDFVVMRLLAQMPVTPDTESRWKTLHYRLRVNYRSGSYEKTE